MSMEKPSHASWLWVVVIFGACLTLCPVTWLFSVSSLPPRLVTASKTLWLFLGTAIKIKRLLMLTHRLRERLAGRNSLGDTQSSVLCQHDECSQRPTRLIVGIPVQGLKSCQGIFSLRCLVRCFHSDVNGGLWVVVGVWNQCHPAAGYHHSRFSPSLDKQIHRFPLAGNHTARVPPVDLSG